MHKFFFVFLSCLFVNAAVAQKSYRITYAPFNNGKQMGNSTTTVLVQNGVAFLSPDSAVIQQVIDYNRKQQVNFISFADTLYKAVEDFSKLPQPAIANSADTLFGYKLKKATFSYFSNSIETWFAPAAPVAAAPTNMYLPGPGALVLKQTINGGREQRAIKIESVPGGRLRPYPYDKAKTISAAQMEALRIQSRYDVVPVFNDAQINFEEIVSPKSVAEMDSGKVYRFSSGTIILKRINISKWKGKDVEVFARLTSRSNGDAYDRTGVVFMLPAKATGKTLLDGLLKGAETMPAFTDKRKDQYYGMLATAGFAPAVEWIRFYTPFGVGHFNDRRVIGGYDWAQQAYYKQDVTALFPTDQDEIYIGAYIGNYDKGGHVVNLSLDVYPGGRSEKKRWIQPVFNTTNIMEMSGQKYARFFSTDTLGVWVNVPRKLKNAYLLYTVTGHGGWGTGDEFMPIENTMTKDGQPFFNVVPWRTDCATYRLSNPASGNFGSGLSSSDLSRSNWCPGTITVPYKIPLTNLAPGNHNFALAIKQGPDDGNNFSYWNASAVIVGEEDE